MTRPIHKLCSSKVCGGLETYFTFLAQNRTLKILITLYIADLHLKCKNIFFGLRTNLNSPPSAHILCFNTLNLKMKTFHVMIGSSRRPASSQQVGGYQHRQNKDGKQANMVKGYNFLKILDLFRAQELYHRMTS